MAYLLHLLAHFMIQRTAKAPQLELDFRIMALGQFDKWSDFVISSNLINNGLVELNNRRGVSV